MSDETEIAPVSDEAYEIMKAMADALVSHEAARGAFIGEQSQETLAAYIATADRVAECKGALRRILCAARQACELEDEGLRLVSLAHSQAYERLFGKKDADN